MVLSGWDVLKIAHIGSVGHSTMTNCTSEKERELDELRHKRHEAFIQADATYFSSGVDEWREANRAYVKAKDAKKIS